VFKLVGQPNQLRWGEIHDRRTARAGLVQHDNCTPLAPSFSKRYDRSDVHKPIAGQRPCGDQDAVAPDEQLPITREHDASGES
jgi:hypothetical protein